LRKQAVAQVLFYADIFLDLKQLKLFYDQDLVDYMAFNAFGLLIPPIVTLLEAFEWSRTPSPELNFFQSRIQSEVLQKIIIVAAVASQSHVLLLVMLSMKFRSTPGRVWIRNFGILGWSCCGVRLKKGLCAYVCMYVCKYVCLILHSSLRNLERHELVLPTGDQKTRTFLNSLACECECRMPDDH